MKLNTYIQDQIKKKCLEAKIEHYHVLQYVIDFYRHVKSDRVFHREIMNTAIDKINEIKATSSKNDATKIAERDHIINLNRNQRK